MNIFLAISNKDLQLIDKVFGIELPSLSTVAVRPIGRLHARDQTSSKCDFEKSG